MFCHILPGYLGFIAWLHRSSVLSVARLQKLSSFPISRCEYFYICVISLPDTPRTVRSQAGANHRVHWVSGTCTTAQWIPHRARYSWPPPLSDYSGCFGRVLLGFLCLSMRTPISSLVLQCSLRHLRCDLCTPYVGPFSRPSSCLCDLFSGYRTLTAACFWHCLSYRNIASVSFTFFVPYDFALSRCPQMEVPQNAAPSACSSLALRGLQHFAEHKARPVFFYFRQF
jgi:hypothetical protein